MLKKYFSNPSFLFLFAGNLYCIWYYQAHPNGFTTVIWIYWLQSVIIGLFNFFDLLTINNSTSQLKNNEQSATGINSGCMAWFFLLHYGGFHLGYALFLLIGQGIQYVDRLFLLIGAAVFFMETLAGFIRRKQVLGGQTPLPTGFLFFLPYLRVVPMHLMILLPVFTGIKASLIFLVLKMVADVLSFMLFRFMYSKNKEVG
ncbi:MAG: DUF6498-containing protein [Ferruginibacter sp.]